MNFVMVIVTISLSFQSFGLLYGHGMGSYCARDCQDVKEKGFAESGVYTVFPVGTDKGFEVYCDMQIDQGGWLVFQRREDGSENFYRGWNDYQSGFGNKTGEHWLDLPQTYLWSKFEDANRCGYLETELNTTGNLALHAITNQGYYELRIDLEDFEGETRIAKYQVFRVKHTEELYKLIVSGYSGDAGDDFSGFTGMAFTTKDLDNDRHGTVNCAVQYNGAGWFTACHNSNLNGLYLKGNHTKYATGVNWRSWRGLHYSLKSTSMKIRRI